MTPPSCSMRRGPPCCSPGLGKCAAAQQSSSSCTRRTDDAATRRCRGLTSHLCLSTRSCDRTLQPLQTTLLSPQAAREEYVCAMCAVSAACVCGCVLKVVLRYSTILGQLDFVARRCQCMFEARSGSFGDVMVCARRACCTLHAYMMCALTSGPSPGLSASASAAAPPPPPAAEAVEQTWRYKKKAIDIFRTELIDAEKRAGCFENVRSAISRAFFQCQQFARRRTPLRKA